jgi:hypothetical protein
MGMGSKPFIKEAIEKELKRVWEEEEKVKRDK